MPQFQAMRSAGARAAASSANLGPGFDVLAAALDLQLTLKVREADQFSIRTTGQATRQSRENLVVRAFETIHPIDHVRFEAHLDIPPSRGLGSSAAAFVAGLLAANEFAEAGYSRLEIFNRAVKLEGHPDNVAAALYGGFTACSGPHGAGDLREPSTISAPQAITPVLVVPHKPVRTEDARQILPSEIPVHEAVDNIGASVALVLGLERSDLALISAGLRDSIHQARRASLFPEAFELMQRATALGALGATISGAGPSVMFWSETTQTSQLVESLAAAAHSWADVLTLDFYEHGAQSWGSAQHTPPDTPAHIL